MQEPTSVKPSGGPPKAHVDIRFGANAVRLPAREWIAAAVLVAVALALAPALWERAERFEPGQDYRLPYDLSNDYWLFARYARKAAAAHSTLVLGDSVVWGQYVTRDQTLSHYLGAEAGGPTFANLGVDGAHPVALAGLVEHYGRDLGGESVLLHCNLLWTASKKHDLRTEKEFQFNHPALVPQFVPRIPCYTETFTRRLGIVVERNVTYLAWANHLKLAYLNKMDLGAWTMEHPYDVPAKLLGAELPPPDEGLRHEPISWTARGIRPQSFEWVDLETSLQWEFFRKTVSTLRRRGNRVFVLVGPFNEPMLEAASRETYAARKRQVEAWLREEKVPCFVAPPLVSEEYADASHPLAPGYKTLARQLLADPSFTAFLLGEEK